MDNELKKKVDGYVGNILINIASPFLRNKSLKIEESILKNLKTILLIKFWGIGNLVMLTPTIKAIRKKFPKSRITFLTLSKNKGLLEHLNYVDEVMYYDLGAMDILRIAELIHKYHKKFDLVIDFEQFLNISSIIAYFLGKYRIGFSNKTRARHKLYHYFISCNEKDHILDQFYELARVVGLHKKDLSIETFDFIRGDNLVDSFLKDIGIVSGKKGKRCVLVGVHVGSSENAEVKRWPRAYFVELINLLNRRLDNLAFVMTGIESERDYADSVITGVDKKNCYNSCGMFNLKGLIYLMKKIDLFIGNDTGPIHLASACGVYCVGLYGPTTPIVYGPYGTNNIVFYEGTKCSPCVNNYSSKSSNCKNTICMKRIKPTQVADAIVNYINNNICTA